MKSQPKLRYWMPRGGEPYLTLARPTPDGRPKTAEAFLDDQVEILKRLVKEASKEEVEQANRLLEDNLPMHAKAALPMAGLEDQEIQEQVLLVGLTDPTEGLEQWRAAIPKMIKEPSETKREAQAMGESLTLYHFLSERVL